MADYNQPQAWFCVIQFEDVYHEELLIMHGLMAEVLRSLRNSRQLSTARICVYALESLPLNVDCAPIFKELAQLGKLLRLVSIIRYDRDFERWKGAFSAIFDNLSLEQREVELKLLATRVLGELKVLEVQKQINPPKEEIS